MISRLLFFFFLISFSFNIYAGKTFSIVIDPGHGGKNLGATYGEILEKQLTLDLSMRLRTFLSRHPLKNVSVHFTRTVDVDIPVKKRVELIEKLKPDLFITIHFNSQKLLSTSRGFEIYYTPDILNDSPDVKAGSYHRANLSFYYGAVFRDIYLKTNLYTVWKLPLNMFVQKHGFLLFEDTTVPGLLLEMAYLTSPQDRACVENPQFMNDAAWFLYEAIKKIASQ
jgi:N-acetylmuramoyl-L-alanine amidase